MHLKLVILFCILFKLNCVFAQQNFNLNSKYINNKIINYLDLINNNDEKFFSIQYKNGNCVQNKIEYLKNIKIAFVDTFNNCIIIKCKSKNLYNYLNKDSNIICINEYHKPKLEQAIIGYKKHVNLINNVDFLINNANGKNIVVGVKEQKMNSSDIDLHNKIIASTISSDKIENHANTISNIIGGAGNSYYDAKGIAHNCRLFSSSFSNLFADNINILNQNKVTIQNHSYGTVIQPFYGPEAASYDLQCWEKKEIVHVFSSGNKGLDKSTTGKYANIPTFSNITGNFKMAKNIISVGSVDELNNISILSSTGPTYDGRLSPHITALGPNGTSDAAAIVSGTAAVMQQVFADSNNQKIPDASLIKAILFNTATDIHKLGIDYKTGFGLLNSYNAIKAIQGKNYFSNSIQNNQSNSFLINIPVNAAQLKITLCWTDSVALINNNKALQNDIDIELIEINTGKTYLPWVLNSFAHIDSLNEIPKRKKDTLNTVEQISLNSPTSGNYKIKIIGTKVLTNNLQYSLVYQIDELNSFRFTNPITSSDINIKEDSLLNINWETFVSNPNEKGSIYVSYNNGINWEFLINIELNKNNFKWKIKDTSSIVSFKMETTNSNFYSPTVIINRPYDLNIDYNCTDSFRLSWQKHQYANSYKILYLSDSTHLKTLKIVTDSFYIFSKAIYPHKIFAIEPILNNNIVASKSTAINIDEAGVYCFYKSFNYFVLDSGHIELSLLLSAPNLVEKIVFEKVNSQNGLLFSYTFLSANSNENFYSIDTKKVSQGINYFRAKIILKNGKQVYTEVLNVIIAAEKSIYLYPNPISSGENLNYILKNLTEEAFIILFNYQGLVISKWPIKYAGIIKMPTLQKGIYFFIIRNKKDNKIDSGKIFIN